MPVPASQLLESAASALTLDPAVVSRYWRALREADLVPAGTSGRGGKEAMVDSDSAATLLVALLGSDSARAAPAAVANMRSLAGSRLFAAYSARTLENERYVAEVTVAPDGATFERAVANLIDLRRSAAPEIGGNFGNVSVWSAQSDLWGQVEVPIHNERVAEFPGEHAYPNAVVFGRQAGGEGISAPLSPNPFVRMACITGEAIHHIAQALGALTKEEWAGRDYPRFERTIIYSRPAGE